jgi:hypothetical protein
MLGVNGQNPASRVLATRLYATHRSDGLAQAVLTRLGPHNQ